MGKKGIKQVSVPYRGATFLNSQILSNPQPHPFPSPIGELHFSILYMFTTSATFTVFPSPIGELHFSIIFHMIGVVIP